MWNFIRRIITGVMEAARITRITSMHTDFGSESKSLSSDVLASVVSCPCSFFASLSEMSFVRILLVYGATRNCEMIAKVRITSINTINSFLDIILIILEE